jgi:methylmalonyl-CoA mutase cobalamin-binding domain/chain
MGQRKIRVLLAKPGLDGHDRGAWIYPVEPAVHLIGDTIE